MPGTKAFDLLRESSPTLGVGILSADLMQLGSEVVLLEGLGIKVIHFDVMDGCFVPKMTAGPPLIKGIKTPLLKDAHLMIHDPLEKVGDYVRAGADIVTVHVESCDDVLPVLRELGRMENTNHSDRGLIRGVALNPGTPLDILGSLLGDLEMIQVLAVNPTVKGMPFDESVGERFRAVQEMVSGTKREILLTLDGGITRENITDFARMGADLVVSGSAVFSDDGPKVNVPYMLNALRS
jgi:ribulose-phosphate 3-epimerase